MGEKVGKTQIVSLVSEKAGVSQAQAKEVIDAFLSEVAQQLSNGNEVALPGFGSFKIGHMSERNGRNPQTGEPMIIPARKVPKFSAGKALKEAVS